MTALLNKPLARLLLAAYLAVCPVSAPRVPERGLGRGLVAARGLGGGHGLGGCNGVRRGGRLARRAVGGRAVLT